jgi:hypothetical protein
MTLSYLGLRRSLSAEVSGEGACGCLWLSDARGRRSAVRDQHDVAEMASGCSASRRASTHFLCIARSDIDDRMAPGAHQAHFTLEDLDDLGEFVQGSLAEKAAGYLNSPSHKFMSPILVQLDKAGRDRIQ